MKKIYFLFFLGILLLLVFVPRLTIAVDYTLNCSKGGSCSCQPAGSIYCEDASYCLKTNSCSFSCPSASVLHSHYVSSNCAVSPGGCTCNTGTAKCSGGTCTCSLTGGACSYACDSGYTWGAGACNASCTPNTPTVTISPPTRQSGLPTNQLNYTVTVKNNDSGSGCSSQAFTLSASPLSGWAKTFNTNPLPVLPNGGTNSTTLNITSPSGASAGDYQTIVTASGTSGSGQANAYYYVKCDCKITKVTCPSVVKGGGSFNITYTFSGSQDYTSYTNDISLWLGGVYQNKCNQNELSNSCTLKDGSFSSVTAPSPINDTYYDYKVSCASRTSGIPVCNTISGATNTCRVLVDVTPPAVNSAEDPGPNATLPSWSNNSIGVTLGCSDSGSDCQTDHWFDEWNYTGSSCGSCPTDPSSYTLKSDFVIPAGTEAIHRCICGAMQDNVGNWGFTPNPAEYKTDIRYPDVTLIGAPPGGWTTTPYTVGVSCDDSGPSGCDTSNLWIAKFPGNPGNYCVEIAHGAYSYQYPPDVQITSHTWVCGAAIDNAGNWGFTGGLPIEYKVDQQGPTVTVTGTGGCQPAAQVHIICDDGNGIGCDNNTYKLKIYTSNPGAGFVCPKNYGSYDTPVPSTGDYSINNNSEVWVCGTALDKMPPPNPGYSISPVHLSIDTTPPSVTINSPNAHSWHNSSFPVSVSISDACGIESCQFRVCDAGKSSADCLARPWNNIPGVGCSSFSVSVGPGANCETQGYDACVVYVNARDNSSKETNLSRKFSIDYSSPQTTIKCGSDDCSHPPYYLGTQVTLICEDKPLGTDGVDNVGCATIYYCFSSSPGCNPNSNSFSGQTGQFLLNNLGSNYIRYYSVDNLGNAEGPIKEMTVDINAGYILSVILAPASTGSGTVNFNPPDSSYYPLIGTPPSHSFAYNGSTPVRITAVADPSSNFTGWSGAGCSGTSFCDLIMNSAKTVFATFEGNNPPVALMHAETQDIEPGHQDGPVGINWVNYNGQVFTIINDSSDSDGTIDSSNYSFTGPGSFHLCENLPGNSSCTIQGMVPGDYIIRLTVTDDDNGTDEITNLITIKNDIDADFECSLDNATWGSCLGFKPLVGSRVYFIDRSSASGEAGEELIARRIWQKDTDPPFSSANETNPSLIIKGTTIGLTVEDSLGRTDSQPYSLSAVLPLPKWKEVSPF